MLFGAFVLEHRAFNKEDTSVEELQAMRSRITLLDNDIVQYLELPIMSEFSVIVLFDELDKKIAEHNCKAIHFDLSMINIPDIRVRRLIFERFDKLIKHTDIISFTTGKKPLVNVAIKFFLNSKHSNLKLAWFSQHREEALAKIYEKLGR